MATHISLLLAAKIYDTLRNDATIQGFVSNPARVYDQSVPDETNYPYITYDLEFQDFNAHTLQGFRGFVQVDVWDQAQGFKVTRQIQDRIYTLLHQVDPNITNFKNLALYESLRNDEKDPDGRTYHGVQRFEFIFSGNET